MIEVVGLRKAFGATRVLDDVDLHVDAAEIAAIVGPSGTGKSTLARCINLLERPDQGQVTVAGQELTALGAGDLARARRSIGTIFQSAALPWRRTATRNVALPLELAGWSRRERTRRVDELLERVGLGDRGGAYPRELSGGQRQRVGIARALALGPRVLLADEATSGLDPVTTRSILRLLTELRDDLDLTVLLITHEMDVVREVADSVHAMHEGRIVESGPIGEIVADPRSTVARGLLPTHAAQVAPAGAATWAVTYSGPDVALDWIVRLAQATGASVSLLGGSVEAIRGRSAGRVTVSVSDPAIDVDQIVAPWGLVAERLGDRRADAGSVGG